MNKRFTKKASRKQRMQPAAAPTPIAPPEVSGTLTFTLAGIDQNDYDLMVAAWKIIQRANGRRPVEDYLESLLYGYCGRGTLTPSLAREHTERFVQDFTEMRESVFDFLAQNPGLANIGNEAEEEVA